MTTLIVQGRAVSIAHLSPIVFSCSCKDLGRDLQIQASFSNHCYTESFDAFRHVAADIIVREHNRVGRVFSEIRHALSLQLPALIAGMPGSKVHQTPELRNYVYAVLVDVVALQGEPREESSESAKTDIRNATYEIFFSIRRAPKNAEHDLRLTVESAYLSKSKTNLRRRPAAIRFSILAYKVLRGEQIRFATR